MFHRNGDGAKWLEISGLKAGSWAALPVAELRTGLAKLFAEVERLMVEEMADEQPRVARYGNHFQWEWEQPFSLNENAVKTPRIEKWKELEVGGESRRLEAGAPRCRQDAGGPREDARTYLWDPVRAVSVRLEISQSMLSYLSKMHSGMSATEMADRLRAKKLKPLFWGMMHKFTMQLWGGAQNFCNTTEELERQLELQRQARGRGEKVPKFELPNEVELVEAFWKKWKAFKRSEKFNKEVWAHECGFASYGRMRRACMLEYGFTPEMLERQIAEEIAEFYAAAATLNDRKRRMNDASIKEQDKPREPYIDAWSAMEQGRPEWVRKMGKLFGA